MIASEPRQYASEGTRWYRQTGESVQDILAKNGNPRPVTLRDARKPENQYIPSVTSVISILAKPGLDQWKATQYLSEAFDSALKDPESIKVMPRDAWVEGVKDCAEYSMSLAREEGSEVHGQIDRWLLSPVPVSDGLSLHVKAASEALDHLLVSGEHWEVEKTFCAFVEGVWVSGKADLVIPEFPMLIDWKTSNKPCDRSALMGYDEHVMQLAAYSMALFGRLVSCENIFLSTSVPGQWQQRNWEISELRRGWEMYKLCFALWTLKNNYLPVNTPPHSGESR